MKVSVLEIARTAHEVNRAFCLANGDTSQVPWEETPANIKESALSGVRMHLDNPDGTPEQSHEAWMAFKIADGWTHGEVKDAEEKTHPSLVPYSELSIVERTKDYLFKAVVDALR